MRTQRGALLLNEALSRPPHALRAQEALDITESKLVAANRARTAALQSVDDLTKQLGAQSELVREAERERSSQDRAAKESPVVAVVETKEDDVGSGRDLSNELVMVSVCAADAAACLLVTCRCVAACWVSLR